MAHMSNPYSEVGKRRWKAYATLYVVNIIVLALSTRVNQFQGFFFMADLFPLGLSITTLVLLTFTFYLDFSQTNSFTARPPFEIAFLSLLNIFWLAFNSFSTSRWKHVPMACSAIPDEFADERVWCRDVQALKVSVWIEFAILFLTLSYTLYFVFSEHRAGNKHVWWTALSRYSTTRYPNGDGQSDMREGHRRQSSFWTWDRSMQYGSTN